MNFICNSLPYIDKSYLMVHIAIATDRQLYHLLYNLRKHVFFASFFYLQMSKDELPCYFYVWLIKLKMLETKKHFTAQKRHKGHMYIENVHKNQLILNSRKSQIANLSML